jgi:hypothetical protein
MNMGPVSNSLRFVLLAAALAFAGACGDDADGDNGGSGGSGGEPDAGATGGTGGGGTGGSGGTGGTGGGGGDCPTTNPNCADAVKAEVCETLVTCELIPGAELTQERCEAEIGEKCLDCTVESLGGGDAGVSDAGELDCDTAAANTDCEDVCGLLVSPPANEAECLDVSEASPENTEEYNACLCTTCFEEFSACIGDDGCWLVVQCAAAVGCNGMQCYAPNACMAIIDEVGATSISVAMATELGNCTAPNCDALND